MSPIAVLSPAPSPTSTAHSTQTWPSEAVCPGFYSPIYSSPPATTMTFANNLACVILGLPSAPRPCLHGFARDTIVPLGLSCWPLHCSGLGAKSPPGLLYPRLTVGARGPLGVLSSIPRLAAVVW